MYFCNDVDLATWEPAVFAEAAFGHQALVKGAAGTLTGTALLMDDAVLGDVAAGMVASVATADGTATQLLEIVSVADATHAVASVLRGQRGGCGIAFGGREREGDGDELSAADRSGRGCPARGDWRDQ